MYHKYWRYTPVPTSAYYDLPAWIKAARIPSEWLSFRLDPVIRWDLDCGDTYGCWPRPSGAYEFTVVNPYCQYNGINMKNAAGLCWGKQFCIQAGVANDPETLGLRIWHEALHGMDVNSDMLNVSIFPNDFDMFKKYVESIDMFKNDSVIKTFITKPYNHPPNAVLRAYYYMLMVQNFPNECKQVPLPPPPVVKKSIWDWFRGLIKR